MVRQVLVFAERASSRDELDGESHGTREVAESALHREVEGSLEWDYCIVK